MTLSSRIRGGVESAPWVVAEVERLEQQLAEAQAREEVLRDAVMKLRRTGDYYGDVEIASITNEVLSMPYDDTTLKALLTKERERCVSAVRNARAGVHPMDAIWALGD